MIKQLKLSVVGYKADDKHPSGYISQSFTKVLDIPEEEVKKLEAGTPLPDQYKPALPKGWFSSPKEAGVKEEKYPFTPVNDVAGIKVVG